MHRNVKLKVSPLPVDPVNHPRAHEFHGIDALILLSAGYGAFKGALRTMPVWSAFNSWIDEKLTFPKSVICPLPLLDAPAPEHSSLLTMMTKMEAIQRVLNGEGVPVLIAADKALYSKLLAIKLNLKKDNWVSWGPSHRDGHAEMH